MARRPRKRSKFSGDGDELNYLSEMIRFATREGPGSPIKLGSLLSRFREILDRSGRDDGSIMLQDHWALLHEVEGGIALAIEHREREIELIERLFSIGGPVGPIDRGFLEKIRAKLLENHLRVGDQQGADRVSERIGRLERNS